MFSLNYGIAGEEELEKRLSDILSKLEYVRRLKCINQTNFMARSFFYDRGLDARKITRNISNKAIIDLCQIVKDNLEKEKAMSSEWLDSDSFSAFLYDKTKEFLEKFLNCWQNKNLKEEAGEFERLFFELYETATKYVQPADVFDEVSNCD